MEYSFSKKFSGYNTFSFLEKRRVFLGGFENPQVITESEKKQLQGIDDTDTSNEKKNLILTEESKEGEFDSTNDFDIQKVEEGATKIRELVKSNNKEAPYILIETIGKSITKYDLSQEAGLQIIKEIFPNYKPSKTTKINDSTTEILDPTYSVELDNEGFAKDAGKNINNPIEPILAADRTNFTQETKDLISAKMGVGTLFVGFKNNIVKLGFKAGKTLDDGINVMEYKVHEGKLVAITEMTEEDITDIKKYNEGEKGKEISNLNLEKSNLKNLSFVNTMQETGEEKITPQSAEFLNFLKEYDNQEILHDEEGNEVDKNKKKIPGFKNKMSVYTGIKFKIEGGHVVGVDKSGKNREKGKIVGDKVDIKKTCKGSTCSVDSPVVEKTGFTEKYNLLQIKNKFKTLDDAEKEGKMNPIVLNISSTCPHCTNLLRYLNTNFKDKINTIGIIIVDAENLKNQPTLVSQLIKAREGNTNVPFMYKRNNKKIGASISGSFTDSNTDLKKRFENEFLK